MAGRHIAQLLTVLARPSLATPGAPGPDPDAVRSMFGRIAPTYDCGNAILSFGVHAAWKRRAVREAAVRQGALALDLATGTGDLAFLLERKGARVVGVDLTRPMLDLARAKGTGPGFVAGDATRLPVADASFDAATIAFGIRNVADPVACLREMRRVVRPGGRVVVLEFGQPKGLLKGPYRFYSRHVLPRVGGLVSGDRAAYEYLERTSAAFPSGDRFLALMEEAGLDGRGIPLTGGVAWVYVAVV